ncbi:MAG TPA: PaaI family thioesterase [Actinomycetota bacterium]
MTESPDDVSSQPAGIAIDSAGGGGANPPPAGVTAEQAVALANEARGGLVEKLGIEFVEIGREWIRARMPVEGNTQPYGILHGGATASLCETVASMGTAFLVGFEKLSVGIDLSITHVRSARQGWVTVTARPLRIGNTIAHWDMQVHDDQGRLVAVSRLTLAVRTPAPSS